MLDVRPNIEFVEEFDVLGLGGNLKQISLICVLLQMGVLVHAQFEVRKLDPFTARPRRLGRVATPLAQPDVLVLLHVELVPPTVVHFVRIGSDRLWPLPEDIVLDRPHQESVVATAPHDEISLHDRIKHILLLGHVAHLNVIAPRLVDPVHANIGAWLKVPHDFGLEVDHLKI